MNRLLTINPGSTSTKLALFEDENEVMRKELPLTKEQVDQCPLMLDQLSFRSEAVRAFLSQSDIDIDSLDMIVARGGSMNGVKTGAYAIDEHVVTILSCAPRSQHASSLAALIAWDIKKEHPSIPIIFYDSPSATDVIPILRCTGMPEIKRWASSHVLNCRIVAREVAEKLGKPYEECDLIVTHLGGGITSTLHSNGKMVDTVEDDGGPMSPQRAGWLPTIPLVNLCFSGRYTKQEVLTKLRGQGGLLAYLGVTDAREIEKKIADGDELAKELYWYMAYQVSKSIGSLAAANGGKLDRIVLTGGMAHSAMLTDMISQRVSFLAPVEIIPGEREMLALARGGLRVLRGDEPIQRYCWLPKDCADLNEVRRKYHKGDISDDY